MMALPSSVRELVRCRVRLRRRPAVHAGERARLGRLPEDQAGHSIEGRHLSAVPLGHLVPVSHSYNRVPVVGRILVNQSITS